LIEYRRTQRCGVNATDQRRQDVNSSLLSHSICLSSITAEEKADEGGMEIIVSSTAGFRSQFGN